MKVAVKERYEGSNVDQLVPEKLHLLLPVSGLAHWLRGLEKPSARGASFISIGNRNRLDSLIQDGWELTYQSYGEHEGYLLPERIKLASLRFKGFVMEMNITRWQFRDFDEPTSALDPEMGFAREVGDRVVFVDGGRIVESAPPEEFFSAPRSERARAFLGQILSMA